MNLSAILEKIEKRGLFQSIKRYPYMPYNMEVAMQVVDAIGKNRNKKFVIDDENRFAYENIVRWIHGDPDMKCIDPATKKIIHGRLNSGIYIGGNTGTGKSWVLEVMSAYCLMDNVQIFMGKSNRCLHWNNFHSGAICDEYMQTGDICQYKNWQIIGIQDLGAEPTENLYMGNRAEVLRQILECRGDRTEQITLITSNLPINHESLTKRYGDRVASRLLEMCNYFEIKGKDRRKLQ